MQKKYEVIGVVGEGAYGIVYKCKNKETGQFVAIKKFKETEDDLVQKTMKRELKMLQQLKHPNCVDFQDAFYHKGNLFLVFEYVEKNLLEVLEESPNGLSPKLIRSFVYQMCKAISYLHKNNIIHRDVKPENLLIDENYQLKLCDFGFARKIMLDSNNNNINPMTDYVATRWYRAPELLLSNGIYGPEVDYWAVGCIMGELADGNPMFPGENETDQIDCIIKILGNLPEEQVNMFYENPIYAEKELLIVDRPESIERRYMDKLGPTAIDFLKGLLQLDPKKRLNGDTVFKHRYFAPLIKEEKEKEEKLKEKKKEINEKENVNNNNTSVVNNTTNINIINYNNYNNYNSNNNSNNNKNENGDNKRNNNKINSIVLNTTQQQPKNNFIKNIDSPSNEQENNSNTHYNSNKKSLSMNKVNKLNKNGNMAISNNVDVNMNKISLSQGKNLNVNKYSTSSMNNSPAKNTLTKFNSTSNKTSYSNNNNIYSINKSMNNSNNLYFSNGFNNTNNSINNNGKINYNNFSTSIISLLPNGHLGYKTFFNQNDKYNFNINTNFKEENKKYNMANNIIDENEEYVEFKNNTNRNNGESHSKKNKNYGSKEKKNTNKYLPYYYKNPKQKDNNIGGKKGYGTFYNYNSGNIIFNNNNKKGSFQLPQLYKMYGNTNSHGKKNEGHVNKFKHY